MPPALDWSMQRSGCASLLKLGVLGEGQWLGGVPDAPPAAEGPSPRRGVHLQAVLPLLLLLLLPTMLPPVHLHGLGGPGLPDTSRAVRQSHGCESDNLQSRSAWLLHLVSTRPLPVGSTSISPEVWAGGCLSMVGRQVISRCNREPGSPTTLWAAPH